MFERSKWLEKYGLVPKVFLVVAFLAFLGLFDLISFFRTMPDSEFRREFKYNYQLVPRTEPEWQEWKKIKALVDADLDKIYQDSKAKGNQYGQRSYHFDLVKVEDLEEKYNINLIPGLNLITNLQGNVRHSEKSGELAAIESDETAIEEARKLSRYYRPPVSKAESRGHLMAICHWLIAAYWKIMIFWFLIYLIRFEEKKEATEKVTRHNHETGHFYEVYEPLPGKLSFYDEILLCPWRFISRLLFWPVYCLAYPHHEDTAEWLRYLRLKARLLQTKLLGYQLSDREDAWLRYQARQPVKEFTKTIESLKNFDLAPQLVRKSLLTAYLSLVLGILFQPAITLAASYSKKVEAHFYGQTQLVLVEHQKDAGDQIRDGTDSPSQQHDQAGNDCLAWEAEDLAVPRSLSEKLWDLILIKPKDVFTDIVHVPISGLLAERCF